jgi:hypothetical protein
MASGTVTVRLPDEVLEVLQKRAEAENRKVSDVVRDFITIGLEPKINAPNETGDKQVIDYLEGFGDVLMSILFQTVGARYFAEMATNYSTDMESLMRQGQPMDKEAKAALMSRFEGQAMEVAKEVWAGIIKMEQLPNIKPGSKT